MTVFPPPDLSPDFDLIMKLLLENGLETAEPTVNDREPPRCDGVVDDEPLAPWICAMPPAAFAVTAAAEPIVAAAVSKLLTPVAATPPVVVVVVVVAEEVLLLWLSLRLLLLIVRVCEYLFNVCARLSIGGEKKMKFNFKNEAWIVWYWEDDCWK